MTQRLRLTSPIGEQGDGSTAHQIVATMVRTRVAAWMLNGRIQGTASNNGRVNQPLPSRQIIAAGASTKDAKRQAEEMLRRAAAQFLKIHEAKLIPMSTTWVDESD
jgi:hypothetical protein